jgi:predicted ATPase
MLTRVYIDNFRCFVNFEYRPEAKQLLLGANGSGKSSLVEAIRYVKQFLDGWENPFTQSTRTRWQDKPIQVIEIEALLDGRRYEYRLEIRSATETRALSLNLESLKVDGSLVFELANGEIRFSPSEGRQSPGLKWEETESALHLWRSNDANVRRFVEWTKTLHTLRIDAYSGKMDETTDHEERWPDYELENLAGWYRYLVLAEPEENLRFLNSLKETLDGFLALRLLPDEYGLKKLRASFTAPLNERADYSISELSDGQRCLVALYLVLHFLVSKGHSVFIDEPENNISIREIQPWLLAAETAVEDSHGQLILISHHPELLNQWANDYGLRFFREENGHVRTEKFKADPDGYLQPSELIARGWESD